MTETEVSKKHGRPPNFSISGLVLGIIAFVVPMTTDLIVGVYIVVVLFAHLGYSEAKRNGSNRWMAIVALVLGYFVLGLTFFSLVMERVA